MQRLMQAMQVVSAFAEIPAKLIAAKQAAFSSSVLVKEGVSKVVKKRAINKIFIFFVFFYNYYR